MKLHWVCKLIERNEFVQSLNAPEIHSWSSTAFKENSSDELRKVKDCHSLNQWSHGNLKSSDRLAWAWLISATFSMSSTQTSGRISVFATPSWTRYETCHEFRQMSSQDMVSTKDIQRCYQYWETGRIPEFPSFGGWIIHLPSIQHIDSPSMHL
jgi:hypothetical protein